MTLAYALHSIRRRVGDEQITHDPKTVFECPEAEYASYLALDAVRAPSDEEAALYELTASKAAKAAPKNDDDGPELAPKHKGGGKFVVVNKGGDTVSPEGETFDSKEAAVAWIAGQAPASTEGLLG